jgi:hypothetical protein
VGFWAGNGGGDCGKGKGKGKAGENLWVKIRPRDGGVVGGVGFLHGRSRNRSVQLLIYLFVRRLGFQMLAEWDGKRMPRSVLLGCWIGHSALGCGCDQNQSWGLVRVRAGVEIQGQLLHKLLFAVI